MRHAHAPFAALVDEGHAPQQVDVAGMARRHLFEENLVDAVDDLEMPRQHALEEVQRPSLQRLRHQRVVGVGDGALGQAPGVLPAHPVLVHQQPHQLGNADRRVRVVDLDRHEIRQIRDRSLLALQPLQDVLQRGADEEILLPEPQLAAGLGAVVRIEHLGQAFPMRLVADRAQMIALVEAPQIELLRRAGRPQAQRVDGVGAVARHRHVERRRQHVGRLDPLVVDDAAVEPHGIGQVRARKLPRPAEAQPVVRLLVLPAAFDALGEHAEFVADAVAVGRHADRGRAVEQAGRQAAEAAVAEAGIGLLLRHRFDVAADFAQGFAEYLVDAEAAQGVHQQPADQELHGEVAGFLQPLLLLVAARDRPALQHQRAREGGGGVEPVLRLGGVGLDAGRLQQVPLKRPAHRRLVESCCGIRMHVGTGHHSSDVCQLLILMQISPIDSIG